MLFSSAFTKIHSNAFHFPLFFAKSWHLHAVDLVFMATLWIKSIYFPVLVHFFFELHTYTRHSTFYSQDIFFLLLFTSIYHHFYSHDSCNNNSFGITNNVLRTLRLSTCEYTKFFVDIWTIWCGLHMQFAFNGCVEHQHNHSAPYTSHLPRHLPDGNMLVTILIHFFIVTEDLKSLLNKIEYTLIKVCVFFLVVLF